MASTYPSVANRAMRSSPLVATNCKSVEPTRDCSWWTVANLPRGACRSTSVGYLLAATNSVSVVDARRKLSDLAATNSLSVVVARKCPISLLPVARSWVGCLTSACLSTPILPMLGYGIQDSVIESLLCRRRF